MPRPVLTIYFRSREEQNAFYRAATDANMSASAYARVLLLERIGLPTDEPEISAKMSAMAKGKR